jgi:hypothetical protein
MPSDAGIVNIALTKLGARRIVTLTDNVKEAREANAIYENQRDNEIRSHFWKFATKRTTLPALTTAPPFGYSISYELPVDCLRVIAVGDIAPNGGYRWLYLGSTDNADYQIEGTTIAIGLMPFGVATPPLTPAGLHIRYMARITDPTLFDPCFVQAFACRLAIELCEPLSAAANKRQLLAQEYRDAMFTAMRINAMEQPPEPLASSSWLQARLPG